MSSAVGSHRSRSPLVILAPDSLVDVVATLVSALRRPRDDEPVETGFVVLPHPAPPLTGLDLHQRQLGAADNRAEVVVTGGVVTK